MDEEGWTGGYVVMSRWTFVGGLKGEVMTGGGSVLKEEQELVTGKGSRNWQTSNWKT